MTLKDQLRLVYLQLRYDALLVFVIVNVITWFFTQQLGDYWDAKRYWSLLWAIVMPMAIVLLLRTVIWLARRLRNKPAAAVGQSPRVTRGLIVLYGRQEVVQMAIHHHRDRLEFVWFILTEQTNAEFEKLPAHWWGRAIGTPELVHDHYLPTETENAVERALSHAAVLGIDSQELTCDVTGGTKAMTVGAFTAALLHDLPLQMTPARHDQERRATAPLPPIAIFPRPEQVESAVADSTANA
ncbi:MAG: hypothetical protein R2932_56770 [Caldilineaceae bacterium]